MPANVTYLSNPGVKVNAVSLTGFCTAARITHKVAGQDTTVFGQTARTQSGTLEDNEAVLTLYLTYGASEVYATLKNLVGTQTVITASSSSTFASLADYFTLTNTYLEELPVLDAKLGEIQSIDITFKGGVYSSGTNT